MLVKPYEPEIAKSLIIIPETAKEGRRMREIRAIVIAIGPEAWKKEKQPRAVIGDKVLISQWVGAILQGPGDGDWYRMVNDEDIYARIVKEKGHG